MHTRFPKLAKDDHLSISLNHINKMPNTAAAATTTAAAGTLEKLPKHAIPIAGGGGGGGRARRRPDDALQCKKHPKHHQSPGVCSLCLREKLTHLASKKDKGLRSVVLSMVRKKEEEEDDDSLSSTPSSVSSYYSSSLGSSCSSPMHNKHAIIPREGKESSSSFSSVSSFFKNGKSALKLTKSRSLASVRRNNKETRGGDSMDINGGGDEKRSGFWSKLMSRPPPPHYLRHRRVEEANLVHSKTVRETIPI